MYDTKDVASQFGVSAYAPIGNHGVGIAYVDRDNDGTANDQTGLSVQGKIGLGGGKNIEIGYGLTETDNSADKSTIGIEYQHRMSKGFQWYAGYNTTDNDGASADVDQYGAGVRYDF